MTGFAILAAAAALTAQGAAAPWVPGSEIVGRTLQVETAGVINGITFEPGGTARIASPAGRVVPANWTAAPGKLCLSVAGRQECYPYARPFEAGQAITWTSDCNAVSRWLASDTNPLAQPPAEKLGERG